MMPNSFFKKAFLFFLVSFMAFVFLFYSSLISAQEEISDDEEISNESTKFPEIIVEDYLISCRISLGSNTFKPGAVFNLSIECENEGKNDLNGTLTAYLASGYCYPDEEECSNQNIIQTLSIDLPVDEEIIFSFLYNISELGNYTLFAGYNDTLNATYSDYIDTFFFRIMNSSFMNIHLTDSENNILSRLLIWPEGGETVYYLNYSIDYLLEYFRPENNILGLYNFECTENCIIIENNILEDINYETIDYFQGFWFYEPNLTDNQRILSESFQKISDNGVDYYFVFANKADFSFNGTEFYLLVNESSMQDYLPGVNLNIAQNYSMYSCADFDFENNVCSNSWQKITDPQMYMFDYEDNFFIWVGATLEYAEAFAISTGTTSAAPVNLTNYTDYTNNPGSFGSFGVHESHHHSSKKRTTTISSLPPITNPITSSLEPEETTIFLGEKSEKSFIESYKLQIALGSGILVLLVLISIVLFFI